MNKLEIEIKWENDIEFSLQATLNDADPITILAAEENGCIEVLWPLMQKTLEAYWKKVLTDIGEEMKS